METNDSPNTSATLLWETSKAVLRGKIISYSSYKKKIESEKEQQFEILIKEIENTYSTNPTEQLYRELQKRKLELNDLINKKNQFLIERLTVDTINLNIIANQANKFIKTKQRKIYHLNN